MAEAAPQKMSTAREQIMSRVRGALAPLRERAPLPDWDASLVALRRAELQRSAAQLPEVVAIEQITPGTNGRPEQATPKSPAPEKVKSGDLWSLFAERLQAVNGTPLHGATALIEFLESADWHHGYCDPSIWKEIKNAFPAHFVVETRFDRSRVDEYKFGITPADGAIAETGTIILSDSRTENRLAALAPWVHVAVIRREHIHLDVTSAIASLPTDPNVVWITGPSKTADVEGILIEGVHGPGVQVGLLL